MCLLLESNSSVDEISVEKNQLESNLATHYADAKRSFF